MTTSAFNALMNNMVQAAQAPLDLTAGEQAQYLNIQRLLHLVHGRMDGEAVDWSLIPMRPAFEMMVAGRRVDLLASAPIDWTTEIANETNSVHEANACVPYWEHTVLGRYLLAPQLMEELMGAAVWDEPDHRMNDSLNVQQQIWAAFFDQGAIDAHTRVKSLHSAGRPEHTTSLGAMALSHLSPHTEHILASHSALGDPFEMLTACCWGVITQQLNRVFYRAGNHVNYLNPTSAAAIFETFVEHANDAHVDLAQPVMLTLSFPNRTASQMVPLAALMSKAVINGVRSHCLAERQGNNKLEQSRKGPWSPRPVEHAPLPRHLTGMATMMGQYIDQLPPSDRQEQLHRCLHAALDDCNSNRYMGAIRRGTSTLTAALKDTSTRQAALGVILTEVAQHIQRDTSLSWLQWFDPSDPALKGIGQEQDLKMILDMLAGSFVGRGNGAPQIFSDLKQHVSNWFEGALLDEAQDLLKKFENDQNNRARTPQEREAISIAWATLQATWRQAPSVRAARKM